MLAGPAMAIPPGTYIERELKSKEEHEAGVAAAPPQPAHTAPSPPRRERENRERASERATDLFSSADRFLASTAALNTFNGSWRIPPISLSVPLRLSNVFPSPFGWPSFQQPRARALERGRAQRADRMSLRFAFFDLLPCRHDPARLVSEPRGLLTLHIPRARHPRRHRSSIDRGVSNRSKPHSFPLFFPIQGKSSLRIEGNWDKNFQISSVLRSFSRDLYIDIFLYDFLFAISAFLRSKGSRLREEIRIRILERIRSSLEGNLGKTKHSKGFGESIYFTKFLERSVILNVIIELSKRL